MRILELEEHARFSREERQLTILHDSPSWRVLTFCFEAGQELPVHSHEADSEVMILVLSGEGCFTDGEREYPAKPGSVLIAKVSEPHGVRAETRMQVLVAISPPI